MGRRTYVGNAGATTLASDITAGSTSIALADATNWPSPTGGTTAVAIIGRNTSSEEKITFSGRSGNTLTGCVRGFDSTAAATHTAGQSVEHGLSATDMDEVNDHTFDITNDDHTQYLNNTRHDVTGRHAFGSALGTPAAAADILRTGVGTTGASGVPARADHGHGYNPPACRVYHNANQSVPNGGNITVAFNSERYDTDVMHDTVTNNSRITFKTAGVYLLTYNQHLVAAADYTYIFTGIRLNGTTYIAADGRQNNASATSPDIAVTTTYKFAVNDYVEVIVQQNSTAARNVETNANYSPEFAATWIGVG